MFGMFIAKIHEFLMCIMCVYLIFEGEKHGLISSFLLIFDSYIEGEFLLFMILLYLYAFSYL
jgi:hypothetical protein